MQTWRALSRQPAAPTPPPCFLPPTVGYPPYYPGSPSADRGGCDSCDETAAKGLPVLVGDASPQDFSSLNCCTVSKSHNAVAPPSCSLPGGGGGGWVACCARCSWCFTTTIVCWLVGAVAYACAAANIIFGNCRSAEQAIAVFTCESRRQASERRFPSSLIRGATSPENWSNPQRPLLYHQRALLRSCLAAVAETTPPRRSPQWRPSQSHWSARATVTVTLCHCHCWAQLSVPFLTTSVPRLNQVLRHRETAARENDARSFACAILFVHWIVILN